MGKLKLGLLMEDKPVKLTIEMPADVYRNLSAYAEMLAGETGQAISNPTRLIAPMIQRFIESDRGFTKARRSSQQDTERGG